MRHNFSGITHLLFVITFLVSSQSFAQKEKDNLEETVVKFRETALKDRAGYEMLREFCEIGPRLSGSQNSIDAINWAKNKLEEIGCDSVWLQPVMVPHWERGDVEELIISVTKQSLNILALGGSVGTPSSSLTGKVIIVNDFDELKEKSELVKNNFVFFNRPVDQGELNTFTAYGKTVDQRIYGAIEAVKFGAIGVIVRSVTTAYDNVPHTGVVIYRDTIPKLPAVAIGFEDADLLEQTVKNDPDVTLELKLNCKTLEEAESFNVIGEITGSKFPEEIILVGAHLDSWDVGDGAHDDGAGVIHSIEVLDLFKRLDINPKRTIRCVLFINEENGSRGAIEYNNYSNKNSVNHLAALESDRGGYTPVGFTVEKDSSAVIKLNKFLPLLENIGIDWIKNGGSGADITRVDNIKYKIGFVPDDQRYMDIHHSPADTFDKVHPREFELGSAAIASLVYILSEKGDFIED